MTKINKNSNGFTAIEFLLVIVTLTVIGIAGFFVAKHVDTKKTATIAPAATVSSSSKPSSTTTKSSTASRTTTTTTTTNTNVIAISQLGIQITVPTSLDDLTYAIGPVSGFGSGLTGTMAWLSSKSLAAADSNCTASTGPNTRNGGYTGDPLGKIAKIDGTYPISPGDSSGQLLLQENGYYIAFQDSTYSCSTNQNAINIQQTQKLALDGILDASKQTAVQLIQ